MALGACAVRAFGVEPTSSGDDGPVRPEHAQQRSVLWSLPNLRRGSFGIVYVDCRGAVVCMTEVYVNETDPDIDKNALKDAIKGRGKSNRVVKHPQI
jgi:hypothetical protein